LELAEASFAGARQDALFAGAALRILQVGLAPLGLGALGLADGESAATQIFGFVSFVVRQSNLLEGDFLF